ncbi:LATE EMBRYOGENESIS ABUNDANT (LEA) HYDROXYPROLINE-RICH GLYCOPROTEIN FAMILY [Salix purpurea]|uniref:LATE EMBRYOGENESIS ABUNDANT (LEA) HYDROXYPROLINE-RICH GLYCOPROTEIN FAMILY n=1 Tax=Salix purpurea TaxID=77065 RepID=A0A9Q0WGI1_SALPP|nr:LATE EMBRYOGENESIS ABUNDANT (LEA) HYDROXYPROLINE-RICH GLYCOPROTEIN FAMILY [Salix purpurea]
MPARKSSQTTGSFCCKCICWTVGLLVLLLGIVGATAGILYLVFKPEIPNYSVDSLTISDLRLNFDMTLYAKFDVKITANNPNKKIGIYYEKGGRLSVWYTKTKLCQGSIPKVLPRSPEHNKIGCELNRANTVWKHFNEDIARATANRTYSIGS